MSSGGSFHFREKMTQVFVHTDTHALAPHPDLQMHHAAWLRLATSRTHNDITPIHCSFSTTPCSTTGIKSWEHLQHEQRVIHTHWATQTARKELQSNNTPRHIRQNGHINHNETTVCSASRSCESRTMWPDRLHRDAGSKAIWPSLARTVCQPPARRECSDRRGRLATKAVINQRYVVTCSCLRVTSTSAR